MTFSARIAPTMPTRPCRFCLGLQDDSVFADFDVDEEVRVRLLRISFDGYGCCSAASGFKKMSAEDSRLLIEAVDRGDVEGQKIEAALRSYFRQNSETIWSEALAEHDLL
jgi:hypothetical protein